MPRYQSGVNILCVYVGYSGCMCNLVAAPEVAERLKPALKAQAAS